MNILKGLILLIALFLMPFSSYAINSNDIITIYIDGTKNVWQEKYIIPDGKDLIINKIYIFDSHDTDYIQLRDNGGDIKIRVNGQKTLYENINIRFDINLESYFNDNSDNFTLFGYLVNEDESIENYIQGNSTGFTKNIFTKADIDFIYFREMIIFFFLTIIKFLSIILGKKSIFN